MGHTILCGCPRAVGSIADNHLGEKVGSQKPESLKFCRAVEDQIWHARSAPPRGCAPATARGRAGRAAGPGRLAGQGVGPLPLPPLQAGQPRPDGVHALQGTPGNCPAMAKAGWIPWCAWANSAFMLIVSISRLVYRVPVIAQQCFQRFHLSGDFIGRKRLHWNCGIPNARIFFEAIQRR